MERLLVCREVAEILHVSRSYAYVLMRRGDIPCVRIGTAVRVRPADLDRYIREGALLFSALSHKPRKTKH